MLANLKLITGKGIRSDEAGSGEYGAPRGDRLHNGLDFLCEKKQPVRMPHNAFIEREARPNVNSAARGIRWKFGKTFGYMFYLVPKPDVIGTMVTQGTIIGYAQSVSQIYKTEGRLDPEKQMDDHIHYQIGKGV